MKPILTSVLTFLFSSLSIIISFAQVTYTDPIELGNRTININKPVGAIQGSGGVTPDGSAMYNIPLFCPPGTQGIQPSISVTYNSKADYGCLGWGWDLTGLSSISRVPKTPIQDGVQGSVQMNTNDAYAIDGNRLIISGYAQGSTTYYTEYANFCTITSYGSSGSGPAYFIVIAPDGTKKEYGNTSDSKTAQSDDASGTIGVWRLNRITDINGNYITYEYNTSSGLISKIQYTGTLSSAPYNEIEFIYDTREDKIKVYPGNSAPISDYWLLTDIHVKCNSNIVKKSLSTDKSTTLVGF